jgi:glutamate decarboxylase
MVHRHVSRKDPAADSAIAPAYTHRLDLEPIPKYLMPERGAEPEAVYRLIHDELLPDGSSQLNLATFVTTWMEPQASRLIAEGFDKNMIDKDEYPQTAEIERREHGRSSVTAAMTDALSDGLRTDRVAERTTG